MHKNNKFTNKNTHKLSETYLVRGTWAIAPEGDKEREGEGEWGRSRDWEVDREIERQNESICVEIALDWEGDSEIERFGLWVCIALYCG